MRSAFSVLFLVPLLLVASPASAQVIASESWTEPYPGVRILEGTTTSPGNEFWAAFVSLCEPYIHPTATPPASARVNVPTFAANSGVQLATNGDFYRTDISLPTVYGMAVGGGMPWPLIQTGVDPSWSWTWYYLDHGWIAFGPGWVEFSHTAHVKNNAVAFGVSAGWSPTLVTDTIPPGTLALVSGFSELIIEGTPVACPDPTDTSCFPDRSDMHARHPRTAMGLTEDRRTFILLVVDGRSGVSAGVYGTELAEMMFQLGAWQAFNLDGGGSTTMWLEGDGVLNVPSDGSPRSVANHWGVFAGSGNGMPALPGSCLWPGGCYGQPVPGAENELFVDFPAAAPGRPEADALVAADIAEGCESVGEPMFCPECPVKRRDIIRWLVVAAELDTSSPPATPSFDDVPADDPDYAVIEAAAAAGITNGCGGTSFCPEQSSTRAQAAALVRRAVGWPIVTPAMASFVDVADTDLFYGDIETLLDGCVPVACDVDLYCPDDPMPRAVAAIFVAHAFNVNDLNACIMAPPPPGGDAGVDGGTGPGDAGPVPGEKAPNDGGGCGCRVGAPAGSGGSAGAILFLMLIFLLSVARSRLRGTATLLVLAATTLLAPACVAGGSTGPENAVATYRLDEAPFLTPTALGALNGILADQIAGDDLVWLISVNGFSDGTEILFGDGSPAAGGFAYDTDPTSFEAAWSGQSLASTSDGVVLTLTIELPGKPPLVLPLQNSGLDLSFDASRTLLESSPLWGSIHVNDACQIELSLAGPGGPTTNLLDILDGNTGDVNDPVLTPGACAAGDGPDNRAPDTDSDGDGMADAYAVEMEIAGSEVTLVL